MSAWRSTKKRLRAYMPFGISILREQPKGMIAMKKQTVRSMTAVILQHRGWRMDFF
jgi:hypothetical protein